MWKSTLVRRLPKPSDDLGEHVLSGDALEILEKTDDLIKTRQLRSLCTPDGRLRAKIAYGKLGLIENYANSQQGQPDHEED